MKVLFLIIAWFILLALCWPLAVLVLFLAPILWLLSLPIRLLAILINATFALLSAILFLPSRVLLGHRL